MADGLLPIGMFSRAALMSVKQLRSYHEMGLLVPADVDPSSGYRLYSIDQLADAAVIARLRSLDLPLAQVREVLVARDPEHTRAVLEAHRATMQARLDDTARIVAELQDGATPEAATPVHVTTAKGSATFAVRTEIAESAFAGWLGEAFALLASAVEQAGAIVTGAAGALYPPEIDDERQKVEAFVPVSDPLPHLPVELVDRGVVVSEIPTEQCAVLVHSGSYDEIGTTYRVLGAWVARHAAHAGSPVRETYLVGPHNATDPTTFRTEISWPIAEEAP
ncbi:MAG: MerR family transcriptional regulator [Acidimicrobiales bacterium]